MFKIALLGLVVCSYQVQSAEGAKQNFSALSWREQEQMMSSLRDPLDFCLRGTWSPNSTQWQSYNGKTFFFNKAQVIKPEEKAELLEIFKQNFKSVLASSEDPKVIIKSFYDVRSGELKSYYERKKEIEGVKQAVQSNINLLKDFLVQNFNDEDSASILAPFQELEDKLGN